MSLKIGEEVPDFTLKDQNGQAFRIESMKGKHPFVIYFYPKDNTPGCTKEACSFRDKYEDFTDLGAEVIGISADVTTTHQKFANKYNLPFTLLSDPNREVAKKFGVKNNIFGLLPGRETYVIDKNGKVAMVFNSINTDKHIYKALMTLKKIK